ncbi:uncharacterized protein [Diabrotica undecimpunctata]|uniref:uncharacterized protein n=1 Tax=Diabrotica undecimpunctata TaxID=50387 RepID=UPI003B632705
MGPIRCCVKTCWKSPESKHRFPNPRKQKNLFDKWVSVIGNPELLEKTPEKIYANNRVCSYHFAQCDFTLNHKLKQNVFPTVNLPATDVNVLQNVNPTPSTSKEVLIQETPRSTTEIKHSPLKELQNFNISEQMSGNSGVTHYMATPSTSKGDLIQTPPRRRSALLTEVNVTHSKKLSPRAKQLYKKAQLLHKQLSRSRKARLQLKRKLILEKKYNITKLSSMDHIRARFFDSQVRNLKNKPKGRRYTIEDKILALALYKQSGSAYKFLSKFFSLPSRKTISSLLNRIPIEPGLHEEVFDLLKAEVRTFKNPLDCHCIVIFDEMAIQAHIQPNFGKGCIEGFENYGFKTTDKIANHAQVFMLRGIRRKWKQPVYYNFSNGATKTIDLVHIIKMIVRKCTEIGLNVIAIVCDQGSNNRAAINYLIKDTKIKYSNELDHLEKQKTYSSKYFDLKNKIKEYVFEVDGRRIIPIYDVPHVFKGLRNNLLKYNLHFTSNNEEKVATWDHIYTAYKMDPHLGSLRLIPKITEQHVNPDRINKMKVANCTQVFSHSVAQAINVFAITGAVVPVAGDNLKLDKKAVETAEFLSFIDSLFDSLNGKSFKPKAGKTLRGAVTKNSQHVQFWQESLIKLETFYFWKHTEKKNV